MDYLKPSFTQTEDTPTKYPENIEPSQFQPLPYQEVHSSSSEFFHPGYLPFFYDYRAVDRGLCQEREACDWEWGEWENHVVVKEESEEQGRGFREEG